MSEAAKHWDWFPELFLFAELLCGSAETARRIVRETLDEVLAKRHGHLDAERGRILLFRGVRSRAIKVAPGGRQSPGRAEGVLPAGAAAAAAAASPELLRESFRGLAEPGRSALALLYLDALDAEGVGKLLGLGVDEVGASVHASRLALHAACVGAGGTGGGAVAA